MAKIRSGFVSNSSSSSFIIIGATLTKKLQDKLVKKFNISKEDVVDDIASVLEEKTNLDVLFTSDTHDGAYTIGKHLVSGDEYLKDGNMSAEEIIKNITNIKKIIGEDADVKLMYGTCPC